MKAIELLLRHIVLLYPAIAPETGTGDNRVDCASRIKHVARISASWPMSRFGADVCHLL